jgi:hypothetical protein
VTRRSEARAFDRWISGGNFKCSSATSFYKPDQYGRPLRRYAAAYLDMQPDISDLERSSLSHIHAHKVGRVLVEDVYASEAVQQELPANRAREPREEGHSGRRVGGSFGSATRNSSGYRCTRKRSIGDIRYEREASAIEGAQGAVTLDNEARSLSTGSFVARRRRSSEW